MLRALLSQIRASFQRRRLEAEFDAEIEAHLAMLSERFVRQGMKPAEAAYAARRAFGGVTQVKDDLRRRRALPSWDVVLRDFRHALRQLRTAKGFTASAALTLALGIGAGTTVFAVFDAVMLRPLPFAEPDRLVAVRSIDRRDTPHPTNLSYPNFFDFRAQNRVFEHLVSYRDQRFTLSDSLPAIQVAGEIVSWDLFPLLGVQPQLGRGFLPDEERPGMHAVVLSDGLWKNRFGSDPAIVGRHIRMNGGVFTVAGVAPAGFRFPADAPTVQLWTTLSEDASPGEFTPITEQRGARVLDVIGRLRPGVAAEQAEAQMNQIAGALAKQFPDDNKNLAAASVMPELERLVGSSRKPLWILLGAVGLVLLIACANVANLLLARATDRAREFALRAALGASRASVLGQLLTEGLMLGGLGTAGGVLLTAAALRVLAPLTADSVPIPRLYQAGIDARVLGFAVLAALLTTLFFTIAPAVHVLQGEPTGALKEGASNIAPGHHRIRSTLVVGQITLAMVLLAGAGLLMASFLSLIHRDPGFRPDHLLNFGIGLSGERNNAAQVAFCDRLLETLRIIPGVQAAATGVPLPLQGRQISVSFDIEERRAAVPDRPHSDMAIVTPDYFRAMGIALLKGRDFTERDDDKAPRVLVVNQAFARKYFPGEEAIGKRIEPGATNGKEGPQAREIVGIVGNAKQVPWTAEPDPIYYFPYKQLSWGMGAVVLRTSVPPQQVEPAVRAALTKLDREAAMYQVRTGEELSGAAFSAPRFLTVLMGSFAAIALALAVVGLYGVLSYTVARRRREIGVRIALGAGRGEILGMVLREAMQLVLLGLTLGLAGAVGVQRFLANLAFGVRSGEPTFVAFACCVMVITSLGAAYVPALRAASVDPNRALRSE